MRLIFVNSGMFLTANEQRDFVNKVMLEISNNIQVNQILREISDNMKRITDELRALKNRFTTESIKIGFYGQTLEFLDFYLGPNIRGILKT